AIAFVNGERAKLRETTEISGGSNTAFDSSLPRGTAVEKPLGNRDREDFPREHSHPVNSSGTVSMTFRLPSELSARLLRVSLDRKLRRQKPFTQQDIVAEALGLWFKKQACAD